MRKKKEAAINKCLVPLFDKLVLTAVVL
jgi:hypothetical protein